MSRKRDQLKADGFRPIEIWVLDTIRPGFAEECCRQSLLLCDDAHEREILGRLEDIEIDGWK